MMDIQKRVRLNPYYDGAVTILGHHNFHLHRPEFGPDGSVNLLVFVDNKRGEEVVRTFNLPARIRNMALLQWKPGFLREVVAMENEGFRPPRRQFETETDAKVLHLPTKPRAKKIKPVVEQPLTLVNEPLIDPNELMAVFIAIPRKDVAALAAVIDGSGSILKMKPLSETKLGQQQPAQSRHG